MRAIGPTASGMLVTIGSYWCGPAYAACVAGGNYEMTRAFGGSQRDAFRNAAIAGATAAAFHGASYISNPGVQIMAHGMIGGVSNSLQGGNFGHGFISAGFTKVASPAISTMPGGPTAQIVAAAIVGGTASSITGGKFANGAVTAAMAYAFNSMSERAERRAAGRNLLLGEDESPHILTRKVVRHRLGLLKEAIDGLITDLSLMDARTFADYVGGSYSEAFEHVIEGARDQLLVDLRRVSIGLGARRINQRLDALGTAAIEYGLTKGFGRAVRAMGGSRIASELTPIEPQLPVSRSTLQRRPSVGCTDSAFDTCSVGWR